MIFEIAIVFIVIIAAVDLWVGVSNDAVNFMNSAIGSRISSLRTILILAAAGILVGAMFSGGMMEIARKGIFDPQAFMSDSADRAEFVKLILYIYLGVMTADIIMLDLYNTFGLPTSTTVSIVSEMVGAAFAVAFWMNNMDPNSSWALMNHSKILQIYLGIFLSVIIAFTGGAIIMGVFRLLFSQDLSKTFGKVGWLWTGLSFSSMSYFLIFKGMKNVSFIPDSINAFIHDQVWILMAAVFVVAAVLARAFARHYATIFKVIILAGTAALAMAFAGNDLVNFIGPGVAAAQFVFKENINLGGEVPTPTWALMISGLIMVIALTVSRKSRSVCDTEVRLASQGEMQQRFSSSGLSRFLVNVFQGLFKILRFFTPRSLRMAAEQRTNPAKSLADDAPPYDMLRASVNLVVASIIISFGTAQKLPLSTTYITFSVAMGASLADRTWTASTAESRVTGMLTVFGGWLVTGFLAMTIAFLNASILYFLGLKWGMIVLALLVALVVVGLHMFYNRNLGAKETVFNIYKNLKTNHAGK